jgi:hypothetical protein
MVGIPIGGPAKTGVHTVVAQVNWSFVVSWKEPHSRCPKAVMVNATTSSTSCAIGVDYFVSEKCAQLLDLTMATSSTSCPNSSGGHANSDFGNMTYYWSYSHSCTVQPGYRSCTTSNTSWGSHTGSVTVGGNDSFYWNSTSMNASHSYGIEFGFEAMVSVGINSQPSPWNATASATLNMARNGHGFDLLWVKVT